MSEALLEQPGGYQVPRPRPIDRPAAPPSMAALPRFVDDSAGLPTRHVAEEPPEPEPALPLGDGPRNTIEAGLEESLASRFGDFHDQHVFREGYRPIIQALIDAGAVRDGDLSNPGDDNASFYNQGQTLAGDAQPIRSDAMDRVWALVVAQRRRDPRFLADIPANNFLEYEHLLRNRDRARLERAQQYGDGSLIGGFGRFVGGAVGSFADPVQVTSLVLGGPGRTLLGTAAREAAANAIVDLTLQPSIAEQRHLQGIDYSFGDALQSVGSSALFGFAFPIAGHYVARPAARALGGAYDVTVARVFEAMPADVQRRWADRMTVPLMAAGGAEHLSVADALARMSEGDAARFTRDAFGTLPTTPTERAALHVLEREGEVADASPFERTPEGDTAHAERLSTALRRLVHDRRSARPPASAGGGGAAIDRLRQVYEDTWGPRMPEGEAIATLRRIAAGAPEPAAAAAATGESLAASLRHDFEAVPERPVAGAGPLPDLPVGASARTPGRFQDTFSSFHHTGAGQGPGAPRPYRHGTHAAGARDFTMPIGTPLRAERAWTFVRRGEDQYGKWFRVAYDDGSEHQFRHISAFPTARSGEAGSVMGVSGASGIHSSAPHTHRTDYVRRDGRLVPIDPAEYIRQNAGGHSPSQAGGASAGPRGTGGGLSTRVLDADEFGRHASLSEAGGRNISNSSPGASASGYFQFTDDTFGRMWRLTFPDRPAPARAIQASAADQTAVMRRAHAYYVEKLHTGGFDATGGNLYLAHALGAENAVTVLHSPHRLVSELGDHFRRAVEKNALWRGLTGEQLQLLLSHRLDGLSNAEARRAALAGERPRGGDTQAGGGAADDGANAAASAAADAEIARLRDTAAGMEARTATIGEAADPMDGAVAAMRGAADDLGGARLRADLETMVERRLGEIERTPEFRQARSNVSADAVGEHTVKFLSNREGPPGISIERDGDQEARIVFRDKDGRAQGLLLVPLSSEARENFGGIIAMVEPGFRRRGIATQLYARAEQEGLPIGELSGGGDLTPDGAAFVNSRRSAAALASARAVVAARGASPELATASFGSSRLVGPLNPLTRRMAEELGHPSFAEHMAAREAAGHAGGDLAVAAREWDDAVWAAAADEAGLPRAAPQDVAAATVDLRAFDDLDSAGVKSLADSLEHDLRAVAAGEGGAALEVRLSAEGEATSLKSVLDAVNHDVDAAAALRGCL